MTKNLKQLAILCSIFLLFSCAPKAGESSLGSSSSVSSDEIASSGFSNSDSGVVASVSSSSSEALIISSSGEPTIESSSELPAISSGESSSSASSMDELPTNWGETDLAAMKKFLGEGITIPFPIGITQNYVEASGTDQDGNSFVVYDFNCANLCAQYGAILLQNGFEQEESGEADLFFYFKPFLDGSYVLYAQTDYYQGAFEIFAWLEVATPSYESFPYDSINSFFSISVNDDTLPPFPLKEGEKYQAYPSGNDYYCVGGYFDDTTSDDDYVLNYAVALEEKGYVVDLNACSAKSETIGLKVEFMATEGYFFMQLSRYQAPAKGDYSLTFAASDFPKTHEYGEPNAPLGKNGLSFAYSYIMMVDTYIQFKKNSGACLYNCDSLGSIASIVVTMSNSANPSYYSPLSLYVSDSKIMETDPSKKVEPSSNNGVYTYNVTTKSGYFLLINEGEQFASKNDSVVVSYTMD